MQIVLGIDTEDEKIACGTPAESLLRRLCFSPAPRVDIVHVVPMPAYDMYGVDPVIAMDALAALRENEHQRAEAQVQRAAERFAPTPYTCQTLVRDGSAIESLIHHAEETAAGMIAISGSHHGPVGALLSGSVARSLVIDARCSLLIAKPPVEGAFPAPSNTGPVRVVIATDHSEYANRCLDHLMRFSPRGISHITLLTAYPEKQLHEISKKLPHLVVDPAEAVRHMLAERNAVVLEKLGEELEPFSCDSRVVAGPVHEAIATAMEQARADLLILGARGHGFLERLSPGSVSLREAMTNPHSILILRA